MTNLWHVFIFMLMICENEDFKILIFTLTDDWKNKSHNFAAVFFIIIFLIFIFVEMNNFVMVFWGFFNERRLSIVTLKKYSKVSLNKWEEKILFVTNFFNTLGFESTRGLCVRPPRLKRIFLCHLWLIIGVICIGQKKNLKENVVFMKN